MEGKCVCPSSCREEKFGSPNLNNAKLSEDALYSVLLENKDRLIQEFIKAANINTRIKVDDFSKLALKFDNVELAYKEFVKVKSLYVSS